MTARHATVQHRPAKSQPWVVVIRVAGKRRTWSYPTKKAAVAHQARLNAAVNAGDAFDPDTCEPVAWGTDTAGRVAAAAVELVAAKWPALRATSRRSLVESAAHIIAACAPRARTDAYRAAVAALTGETLEGRQADTWRSVLQTSPPAATLDLRRVLAAASTNLDGTPAAASTVRRRRQALSQIVEQATGARPQLPQPARGTRTQTTARIKPTRVGTVAQAVEVIAAVPAPGARVAFALMLYGGLRPAEAAGLRWANVDLAGGVITVAETLPGGGATYTDSGNRSDRQPPKWRPDGSARAVPIVEPLAVILGEVGTRRGPVAATRTRGHYSTSSLGHAWAKARGEVGGEWPTDRLARPYDLRHTHATIALNAGIPVPEMAARLGHAPAMLLDTYADVVNADAARWTATLTDALGG